jgi:hypothetical protein
VKLKICLLVILLAFLFSGCGGKETPTTTNILASSYPPYEELIRTYWAYFNKYNLEKCMTVFEPSYAETKRAGVEADLKNFEQGRMLGVKLLVDSVSPLVTLADGTLEARIVLKISPRGLADDRFLIYNLVQVKGAWKISRQYDDPLKSPPGTKPENLTAVSVTAAQVKLTWESKSTRATGVRLERATDKAFKNDLIKIELAKDANGYTDTAVTPGATYYYRVSAFNVAGNSQPSSKIDVTIPAS